MCIRDRILGVHTDAVGWIRGGTPAKAKMWRSTGVAADSFYTSALGCVAAAFGPIEAQGRGSLHPHILVWLLLISMTDAIDVLMRDRAAFKTRIREWMQAVIAAIVTTQETSVEMLPARMVAGYGESAAASDSPLGCHTRLGGGSTSSAPVTQRNASNQDLRNPDVLHDLSLIHISEPTRPY